MTFSLFESSRAKSSPVELFFFKYGVQDAAYYAYTNAERPITVDIGAPYGAVTFTPTAIKRSSYSATGSLDKSAMSVQLPQDATLIDLFRVYPTAQTVQLRILKLHTRDPDQGFITFWQGRVLSFAIVKDVAKLDCRTVTTSLRRTGLQRNYQYQCPYQLYGDQCKANEVATTVTQNVEAVGADGATKIRFASGWVDQANAALYVGGKAVWTNPNGEPEIRTILVMEIGRIFTLAGLLRGLIVGQAVQLVRGCDHKMTGCNLHTNINNFGGQPFIPEKNPVGFQNIY